MIEPGEDIADAVNKALDASEQETPEWLDETIKPAPPNPKRTFGATGTLRARIEDPPPCEDRPFQLPEEPCKPSSLISLSLNAPPGSRIKIEIETP